MKPYGPYGATPARERIIRLEPAFDRRNPDPKKDYGVHGVELRMVLKGAEGAVQFLLMTNWHLRHVQDELDQRTNSRFPHLSCHPLPSDLGYHSPVPHYEGQTSIVNACEWLDGKPCYYDGSSLAADTVYARLLSEGDEGVWAELESYYARTFAEHESDITEAVDA